MLGIVFHAFEMAMILIWLSVPLYFFLKGRRKAGVYAIFSTTIPTLVFLFVIAIPDGASARERAQRAFCLRNLEIIANAIKEEAKANEMKPGDAVETEVLYARLPRGQMPICPAGGNYTVSKVGATPVCSLEQHKPDGN